MKIQAFHVVAGAMIVAGFSGAANAQFSNRLVDPPATFGDNNQIDTQTEADQVLASPPAGSTITTNTSPTINFPSNAPSGFGGDDFAVESIGYVDIASGSTGTFNLYINGDDGFSLLRNGTEIGRFENPTCCSNTTISNVTLNDGDKLILRYFERGGGESNQFRINDAAGAFVGDAGSGILITTSPVPEPATLTLVGMGAFGLLARRRRI